MAAPSMTIPRLLPLFLMLLIAGPLRAETPEERAKKVTVTMTLTDVPPKAAAEFVQAVSSIKIHYQDRPGDQLMLSVNFENMTADEALRYIAKLARMELSYTAAGAHFTPQK